MKKNLEILWEGYLPLSMVRWEYNPEQKFVLPPTIQERCDLFWEEQVKKHPEIYDGNLIAVYNIEYLDDEIVFHLGNIRYSQITYHYKNKLPIENSLGSLGFQALIYNLSHTHIVLGQRVSTSDYRPGAYGTPGGIFEVFDVKGTLTDACIREIQEETFTAIKPETMRLLSIFREEAQISVGLLIEVESLKDFEEEEIEGNEEWENKQLQWYPVADLSTFADEVLMDSLLYAKNML